MDTARSLKLARPFLAGLAAAGLAAGFAVRLVGPRRLVAYDLGGGHAAGAGRRSHRDCDQFAARRPRPRHRRRAVDDGGAARRAGTGRGHRRADVCRRPAPGELRRAGGPARDDGAAVAGAAHGRAPPRRRAGGGRARAGDAGRPAAGAPGRRGGGGRHGGRRRGGARPVGAHRRGAAGAARRRPAGHERLDQCRRGLRSGRLERAEESTYAGIVRLVEAAQRSRAADVAAGRPLRHCLPRRHRGAGRRRLGAQRRSDPGGGGAGGGDALSAHPGGAGGDRVRACRARPSSAS